MIYNLTIKIIYIIYLYLYIILALLVIIKKQMIKLNGNI